MVRKRTKQKFKEQILLRPDYRLRFELTLKKYSGEIYDIERISKTIFLYTIQFSSQKDRRVFREETGFFRVAPTKED